MYILHYPSKYLCVRLSIMLCLSLSVRLFVFASRRLHPLFEPPSVWILCNIHHDEQMCRLVEVSNCLALYNLSLVKTRPHELLHDFASAYAELEALPISLPRGCRFKQVCIQQSKTLGKRALRCPG